MRTLTLLVKGVDLRWETADKTKLLALIKCERSAFIPVRIGENSIASKGDTKGPAGGGGGGGHDRSNIMHQDLPPSYNKHPCAANPSGGVRIVYQAVICRVEFHNVYRASWCIQVGAKKKMKDQVDLRVPTTLVAPLITMSQQSYALFCMGNPLLDIQVTNGEQLLEKYNLNPNDAILALEKHLPMLDILSPILRTLF